MTALTLRPGNALMLLPSLTPAPVKLKLDTSMHTGKLNPLMSTRHTPLLQLPMPRLWPPLAFQTVPTHGATSLLMALPPSLSTLAALQLPPARLLPLTHPRPVPGLTMHTTLSSMRLMAASLRNGKELQTQAPLLMPPTHTEKSFATLQTHLPIHRPVC
jgi:hypothetical protein